LVKAHPGYSGTIKTATQQLVATLGWGYFEKLAKQKVMQLQSAADPPKKVAAGERAIQVDGADYTILQLQDKGEPVQIVYATPPRRRRRSCLRTLARCVGNCARRRSVRPARRYPGYFASKALATRSATGNSTEV
jgi:hypothetical protein